MALSKLKEEILKCAVGVIEETGPKKASGWYCFPPDFIGFSGHFPGHPILPAFVQVMGALAVIEKWKSRSFELSCLERAKFRMEIHPGQEISLQCMEYGPENAGAFEVKIVAAEGLASSFLVKLI
jgi:3-hydroxyacyl-[acyl-carrier-protein] dehydratase